MVVPTLVLTVLLVFGLWMLPPMLAPAPEGSLKVTVTGEQWWWRVSYERPGHEPVDLANELYLPAGEPVQFILKSSDVIHAFWIPSLAGKRDMIPGRVVRLAVTPKRTGVYRGACAEYCGTSHALMNFFVKVVEKDEFERWFEGQASGAVTAMAPIAGEAGRGRDVFMANGCGACHAVRGTPAKGQVGPDLTHVGSRMSLFAGVLTNDTAAFLRLVSEPVKVKPGVLMPHFGMVPEADRKALAAYLEGLK